MTATCVLQQPRFEHSFEPKETLTEYDQMKMTVRMLTPRQINTLMNVVHSFNKAHGSLQVKATVEKNGLALCQEKISKMNATVEKSPLFTPQVTVPTLPAPKKEEGIGLDQLAVLFYANGLRHDCLDDVTTKSEIDANQKEATKLHEEKVQKIKEKIKSEAESSNWGITISVFSWIGSLLGIITGIALIATGVGAVAGAMLLVGGVCTLGSQILEVTGGWDKIAQLLPDDTSEKKAAIKTWIQLAIAILGVIMGLAGGVLGGFTPISEGMQFANAFMGGFVLMAMGVTQIGKGIVDKKVKDNQAAVKRSEIKLAENDQKKEDLIELIEDKYSRRERLSHFLSTIFYLMKESNRVLRRSI